MENLIQSLYGSNKRPDEFITLKKNLKINSNISKLTFSFPVDVFQVSSVTPRLDNVDPNYVIEF